MIIADPPRRVSPATAAMAPDAGHVESIEPAVPTHSPDVTPADAVEPAVTVDDPMKFAPQKLLEESYGVDDQLSVIRLRFGSGTDFESSAAVCRGATKDILKRLLPCIYDERDFTSYGEILRFIVLKEQHCFVYTEETDPGPIYTIPMGSLKPVVENPKKPHRRSVTVSPAPNTNVTKDSMVTVLLLDARGVLAYQFTFDVSQDKNVANKFVLAVQNINTVHKQQDKVTSHKQQDTVTSHKQQVKGSADKVDDVQQMV